MKNASKSEASKQTDPRWMRRALRPNVPARHLPVRSTQRSTKRRGLTLVELFLVLVVVAVLLAVLLPLLAGARRGSARIHDATMLRQLHTAFLVWSRQADGRFPTPSLIEATTRRARAGATGDRGKGDPAGATTPSDFPPADLLQTQDTHAALYAACISQNYFSPTLCVSRAEASGHVAVMSHYNFNAYDASRGVLWDKNFKADLDTTSHLSFATLHLFGERSALQWRESLDADFVVVGNRGVRDGRTDPATYDASVTLKIHGPSSSWEGNLVFNDNHVEFATAFTPPSLKGFGANGVVPDNVFRDDPEGAGGDVWLTMIRGVSLDADGQPLPDLSWD